MKKPRHWRLLRVYTIDEIMPRIVLGKIEILGGFIPTYRVNFGAARLQTFLRGLGCVTCGKTGSHFVLEQDFGGGVHMNLYAGDAMMTSDHIIPKSKGGPDSLDNRQPMCFKCNSKKADRIEPDGKTQIEKH